MKPFIVRFNGMLWLRLFWLRLVCSFSLGLLYAPRLLGQAKADAHPTQAYWRVKTYASSQSTLIEFYNADRQLVYQEVLPEKYVKLTAYNRQVLDSTLQQVVQGKLLTHQLRTRSLATPAPTPQRRTAKVAAQTGLPADSKVACFLSQQGQLRVLLTNPSQKPMRVTLSSVTNPSVDFYHQVVFQPSFHIKLDLQALEAGQYRLRVNQKSRVITYQLNVQPGSEQNLIRYQLLP